MGEKGYLGAIGDDFPSIFPIAFGLIFFFGSITITYNNYNQKRDIGQTMRANLLLSKGARRETLVTEEAWGEACQFFKSTKANYGVGGYMMIEDEEGKVYEFGGETEPFCTDIEGEGVPPDEPDDDAVQAAQEGKKVALMKYPIAVKEEEDGEEVAKIKGLRVVTWK